MTKLRVEAGMTQRILARNAGIGLRTLRSVERGSPCRMTTKRRLLRALRVPFPQWREVFKDG